MSLKAKLSKRELPTALFPLRTDDDRGPRAELAAAQDAGDERRIAAAQAVLEACYEQITIRALPPGEVEELLEQHPPTEEQAKRNWIYNPVTFPPALLAACIDSDITADDWAQYTTKGPMTRGEANTLFNTVWDLNYRVPDPWLGKGSTTTVN